MICVFAAVDSETNQTLVEIKAEEGERFTIPIILRRQGLLHLNMLYRV